MNTPISSLSRFLLFIAFTGACLFRAEELPRLGFLGARVSASGKAGEGAAIVRIVDGSEAQKIGLTTTDKILLLNGRAIDTDLDVENFFDRQPANARLNLEVLREGKRIKLEATIPALAHESFPGIEHVYDEVRNAHGQRLRTIVTRPAGSANAKLPAVFIVGC